MQLLHLLFRLTLPFFKHQHAAKILTKPVKSPPSSQPPPNLHFFSSFCFFFFRWSNHTNLTWNSNLSFLLTGLSFPPENNNQQKRLAHMLTSLPSDNTLSPFTTPPQLQGPASWSIYVQRGKQWVWEERTELDSVLGVRVSSSCVEWRCAGASHTWASSSPGSGSRSSPCCSAGSGGLWLPVSDILYLPRPDSSPPVATETGRCEWWGWFSTTTMINGRTRLTMIVTCLAHAGFIWKQIRHLSHKQPQELLIKVKLLKRQRKKRAQQVLGKAELGWFFSRCPSVKCDLDACQPDLVPPFKDPPTSLNGSKRSSTNTRSAEKISMLEKRE